jgi:hypothetical protein
MRLPRSSGCSAAQPIDDNLRAARGRAARDGAAQPIQPPARRARCWRAPPRPTADVSLHVFADTPEDVAFLLIERGVRYRTGDRRVRLASGEHASYPSFEFETGDVAVEATVFPANGCARRRCARSAAGRCAGPGAKSSPQLLDADIAGAQRPGVTRRMRRRGGRRR